MGKEESRIARSDKPGMGIVPGKSSNPSRSQADLPPSNGPRQNDSLEMKTYPVTLPEIGLLSGTRALAAAGLAFLVSEKIRPECRRAAGWSLLGAGSVVFIALVVNLVLRNRD